MNAPNLRTKALIIAAIFAILVIGLSMYVSHNIDSSKEDIIASSTEVSKKALNHFSDDILPVLQQVWIDELEGKVAISRSDERRADSLLSKKIYDILKLYDGIEGGIYFWDLDEFIGYSYPSIPSPKPVFGPPPRSYNIIRDQARVSISENKKIVELHGFDPAIFPLATAPLEVNGIQVAAVWARVHIGRELAATGDVTRALINMTLIVTLLGFIIALTVSWRLKASLEEIQFGLDKIKLDNAYRLPERKGLPGFISHYINDLMSTLFSEQQKRRKLERDLHQKEKMATLGKMIAGAAHEINTPISIIKTRIQIWERHLKKANGNQNSGPFSVEAMQLVCHEIDRVSELVKRLLIFSRPVSSQMKPCNLTNIIHDRMVAFQNSPDSTPADFTIHSDSKDHIVHADKNALEQVFVNIFNNSLQAGSTELKIEITNVVSSTIKIRIIDNGSGMSKESLQQIFDPFFTTKPTGTGLGTSIAFEIIRAHNGNIEYEPNPEGGTICTIEFPVAEEQETPNYA